MDIKHLRIFPDVIQKYVVVKAVGTEPLILWGNPNVEWHKDIVAEIVAQGIVVEKVLGGGRIKIDTESNSIYVWGKSSVYGEVSFSEVKNILKRIYLDFTILEEAPFGG